jgi:remodeling and spacing factor 1
VWIISFYFDVVSGFSVNDDSDESIEPRRKKTRRLWQDSDSEESDSTWGRKKKR